LPISWVFGCSSGTGTPQIYPEHPAVRVTAGWPGPRPPK
jgi:hypothetical protein